MAAYDNATEHWVGDSLTGIILGEVFTNTNGVTFEEDTIGSVTQDVFTFVSASSKKLIISSPTNLDPGDTGYTISIWFENPTAVQSYGVWLANAAGEDFIRQASNPINKWVSFDCYDDGSRVTPNDNTWQGQWNHIVLAVAAESGGTRNTKVYKNAVSVYSEDDPTLTSGHSFSEFTLGYDGTSYANGGIARVTFFKGLQVGATQVSELYNSGNPPTHPSEGGGASSPKQASSLNLGLKGLGF